MYATLTWLLFCPAFFSFAHVVLIIENSPNNCKQSWSQNLSIKRHIIHLSHIRFLKLIQRILRNQQKQKRKNQCHNSISLSKNRKFHATTKKAMKKVTMMVKTMPLWTMAGVVSMMIVVNIKVRNAKNTSLVTRKDTRLDIMTIKIVTNSNGCDYGRY